MMQAWFQGLLPGLERHSVAISSVPEPVPTDAPLVVVGRPSNSREAWEHARECDATDLNRILEAGGDVEAYVVQLWSTSDLTRALQELQGFDDADVYVVPPEVDAPEFYAAIATAEWPGAGWQARSLADAAIFIHNCASLDVPFFLSGVEPTKALIATAFAIEAELSPREIEGLLASEVTMLEDGVVWQGQRVSQDAVEYARDLFEMGHP